MSLRVRLVLCLAAVLAVTLGVGCALAGWHAAASVRTEMRSALNGARQSVVNGIDEMADATGSAREPAHLVATFNGNRHVRAALLDAGGAVLFASSLSLPPQQIPDWFRRAIGPAWPPVVLALPPGGAARAIALTADPTNEVGEVWNQARDGMGTLAVFFGLTILLIHWTVGRAFRPIARLEAVFGRIGSGDYATRLDLRGSAEISRLAAGFNRMAGRLADMEAQNRRLQEQMLTLQEEERAELARDLHDEIGPLLFAAGVDAAGVGGMIETERFSQAGERVAGLQDAIAQMQRHIRAMLGRLRPDGAGEGFAEIGLAETVGNLVAFWRSRRPDIAFALDITAGDDLLPESARATACRVVQESLCNAVRHGRPSHIDVSIVHDGADVVVRVSDDGIGPGAAGVAPGFGLVGMRERVRIHAGSLAIAARAGGRGLAVTARLPCEAAA